MVYHPSHSFPCTDTYSKKILYFEPGMSTRWWSSNRGDTKICNFQKIVRPDGYIQPSRLETGSRSSIKRLETNSRPRPVLSFCNRALCIVGIGFQFAKTKVFIIDNPIQDRDHLPPCPQGGRWTCPPDIWWQRTMFVKHLFTRWGNVMQWCTRMFVLVVTDDK